ncbi:MAG: nitronate monooxygenase [Anaplasmataceae bacterium]|nr:nitronate monooxygenase [Anaplasmataceae bacterium]
MLNNLQKINISGRDVWPIIEGGKGIGISDGSSAGAFAATGAVGTFSGVHTKYIDQNGEYIPIEYKTKTRLERHNELITYSIKSAVSQARIAHKVSGGNGCIHMNILWEIANCPTLLEGILEQTEGLIHGVTGGAGMPYKLSEIATRHKIYYYPIISSMRAFRILWKKSYKDYIEFLGGVVYEDPWLAGGHNGLSSAENPLEPQEPYPRLAILRKFMNEVGLECVPIIMAGGVWNLNEWSKYLNNPEIGKIAFQFGTRPLLTQESPISDAWKKKLLTIKEGEVILNKFSPTGFYSSATKNNFIVELQERSKRQILYRVIKDDDFNIPFSTSKRRSNTVFIMAKDLAKVEEWQGNGFDTILRTPDKTLIFVQYEKALEIRKDQVDCMGCLSQCRFSNWKDSDEHTTNKLADPRSYCIQKTLQNAMSDKHDLDNDLLFSGHNAYRFGTDKLYANNHIPTIAELVEVILSGN